MELTNRRQEESMAAVHATETSIARDPNETLPVLEGQLVTLRALRLSDAPSLSELLTTPEVCRFISKPPSTVEGFERFITGIHSERPVKQACFAVTLTCSETAIGMFQVREIESPFRTAECGCAIGSAFWGTGVFEEAANLLLEYVFEKLRVHRLEARAAVKNGQGLRALQKLGAVQEGVLRKALYCNGQYLDQAIYAILEGDWRALRKASTQAAHAIVLH